MITFPKKPLVACINAVATDVGHAFINLTPAFISIKTDEREATIKLNSLFISDGMSVPKIADGVIEPIDGIVAGHIHDMLYSRANAHKSDEVAKALGMESPQKAADEVMLAYLKQHSPGINKVEATAAYAAVRVFGDRHFRHEIQDDWRRTVAYRIGVPWEGRGANDDMYEQLDNPDGDNAAMSRVIARLTGPK